MNVIFFGSSSYCLPLLDKLNKYFNLKAIVTHPDKKKGRNQLLTASYTKLYAQNHHLLCFTPKDQKELIDLTVSLKKLKAELFVVADYGQIIPKKIFTLPKYQTLNIHFSKLPKYRGPSPVQYTLLNGEKSAWISVVQLEKNLDDGDIIYQKEVSLSGDETAGNLYKMLFYIISDDLSKIISDFTRGKIKPTKQDETQATYTRKISKEDGFIPWDILTFVINNSKQKKPNIDSWPLKKIISGLEFSDWILVIEKALRAFTPWPGLWTQIQITKNNQPTFAKAMAGRQITKRLKILKVHLEFISSDLSKSTRLVLDSIQLEGKNPITLDQLIQGYPQLFNS